VTTELSTTQEPPAAQLLRRAVECAEQALTSMTEMLELLAHLGAESWPPSSGNTSEQGAKRAESYNLTNQERRVLTLLAAGLSNRRIAEYLGISDKTAKNYVHTVLVKLDVSTRTEAASKALSGYLVDPDECRRVRLRSSAANLVPYPRFRAGERNGLPYSSPHR
jgi:DNA-binding NarL/FixJ family response regulator